MKNQIAPLRLLTLKQAAELLHLPTRKIRDMISRKEVLAFKVGNQWRFRKNDLTNWSQARNKV